MLNFTYGVSQNKNPCDLSITIFLLCKGKKVQDRWHRKYFTPSLPGELLLHLLLLLPAFLLTKEFVRHV